MHTIHSIKRVFVVASVALGLVALSGCGSSDTNDSTKNDVVTSTASEAVTSVPQTEPYRTLFVGDTFDDGNLLVYTSLEVLDGMDVIVIKHDNSERDANFFLEHWFLVTSSGSIQAFRPDFEDPSIGTVWLPNLKPGETYTVQYWAFGDRYEAVFKQPGT